MATTTTSTTAATDAKKRKSMASFFWHKRYFELLRDGRFCWFKRQGAPCLGAIMLANGAFVQRSSKPLSAAAMCGILKCTSWGYR